MDQQAFPRQAEIGQDRVQAAHPAARTRRIARPILLALLGVLIVAAALRLQDLNWDRYQHIHPDERFIVWVADTVHWPGSLSAAFNPATSPLNPFRWPADSGDLAGQPRNYAYGHFPLYLLVIVAHLAQVAASALSGLGLPLPQAALHLAGYDYLSLVGRVISVVADLGTILLVYALARRLYGSPRPPGEGRGGEATLPSPSGRGVGGEGVPLLAASAYAFAVLPIQLSHFYAVDVVLTFFVIAAVAVAARGAETGEKWAWPLAGALAGLAIGSKFSAFLLAAPLIVAALYRLPGDADEAGGEVEGNGRAGLWHVLAFRLATLAGAALAVFLITNPFAALDFRSFLRQIASQNAMVTGAMDAPYTRQYAGTLPYWYFVRQLSQWGLGWPLGLLAWGGLIWAALRAGLRRARPAEVVALAWAWPYFALTGAMYAKFLRYMLPLLPFLIVFGAGAAFAAWRWFGSRWGSRGRAAAGAAGLGVALFTVAWVLAFSGIYAQQHPWIQASNWIYKNVPEGSKLLSEHWDDTLPLAMDELPGRPPKRSYVQVQLPLFDPDTSAKLDQLVAQLSSADYVVLATPRLSAPIGRLPARYPMTSQYYRLLADGGLGYTLAADFTAYPRLAGLVIPDGNADESFSVYDHPHVRIYANTEHLAPELLRARLGRYLPLAAGRSSSSRPPGVAAPVRYAPSEPTPDPGTTNQTGLMPPDDSPSNQSNQGAPGPSGMNDFRWDRLASQSPPLAVLFWWLVVGAFGWAAWPLLFPLFGGLRDRGYGISRLIGWLLVGWVHWLGVSLGLWTNSVLVIALLLALLIVAGLVAGLARRRAMAAFFAERGRLLLAEEAVFAVAFLAFAGIRLLDPDLWQPWNGGEKFMEFAFLNATLRSPHFPPYDPYFAGGTINYYYYGLYLVTLPIKLTGIFPEVAFNLAVPGLFALLATALFSVGASLAPRASIAFRRGGLAILLALLTGNLSSFTQVLGRLNDIGGPGPFAALRGIGKILAGAHWPGFDYWSASRVIPFTINEFPFWSFLFADLHPHLIAMPVGVAAIALSLNWLMLGEARHRRAAGSPPALKSLAERAKPDESGSRDAAPSAQRALFSQPGPSGPGLAETAAETQTEPSSPESGSRDAEPSARRALFSQPGPSGPGLAETPAGARPDASSPLAASRAAPSDDALGAGDGRDDSGGPSPATPEVVITGDEAGPVGCGSNGIEDASGGFVMNGVPRSKHRGMRPAPRALRPGYWSARGPLARPFGRSKERRSGALSRPGKLALLALFVIVLGALGPTNTWDLPVYLLLATGAFWLAAWRGRQKLSALRGLALAAVTGGLAIAAYLPFYQHYQVELGDKSGSIVSRFLTFTHNSSPFWPWVNLWLFFLFPAFSFTLWALWRKSPITPSPHHPISPAGGFTRPPGWRVVTVLAVVGAALLLAMLDRPAAALVVLPLGLALVMLLRRKDAPQDTFTLLLFGLGLGIVGGIELVNLRDFLEGSDWYRMNTVFKFGVPAWLALGLAGSVALPRLWRALDGAADWLRWAWRALAVLLLAASLFFLPFGIPARVNDRFPGARPPIGTLDGTAYMTVGRYAWPDDRHPIVLSYDYQAIHWMLDNVAADGPGGAPVVAEAPAGDYQVDGAPVGFDYYRAGGLRVASLTGFPTFVGQHQFEQRAAGDVYARTAVGQQFFRTTDPAAAWQIIRDLDVRYIYVGQLERLLFAPQSLAKFDSMVAAGQLQVAYRNPQVLIYRVLAR